MLIPQENPKGIHLYSLELKHNFYKKYFAHFLLRKHILSSKRTPHSSLTQSQEVSSKRQADFNSQRSGTVPPCTLHYRSEHQELQSFPVLHHWTSFTTCHLF